jgi:Arc/MetJ-type ribon-helix-helix transcriptional regulator
MKKRTTIYLDESDRQAIMTIKQTYGVTSDSDAIRLALRLLSEKTQEKKSDRGKEH